MRSFTPKGYLDHAKKKPAAAYPPSSNEQMENKRDPSPSVVRCAQFPGHESLLT